MCAGQTSAMRLSTRLIVAMVALVLVTAAAVGILTYRNIEAIALPGALDRIETHTRILATEFEAPVIAARADVRTQGRAVQGLVRASLAGGRDPLDETPEAQWRNALAARFVAELTAKPAYARFGLVGIADGGREIVRVDRLGPGGSIRVVPDAELQRLGDRPYFKAIVDLEAGQVYVALVNVEPQPNAAGTPAAPTLWVAAPVFAADAKPFGFLSVAIDLRPAFARILAASPRDGAIYIVNERGNFLAASDHSRASGSDLGGAARIQDEFPPLAQALAAGDWHARIIPDREGAHFGVAVAPVRLAEGRRIDLIESVPRAQIMAAANAARDASLLAGLVAVLGAIALAVLLARSLTRPLAQITAAVDRFTGSGTIQVPTDASGEVGVLARSFARMAKEVQRATAALGKETEERRHLFETSLDLILITDGQGNYVQVSPSAAAVLGYKPEEMIGRNAAEFLYPGDLERTRQEMRLARRGRHFRNFECRYCRKDGSVATLAWSGVWSASKQEYFLIGRDMTDQKLAQEKFALAVEASPSGVVMVDATGIIVLVNAETERMFGYRREELIGQSIETLVPTRLRAGHVRDRMEFVARPETRRMGMGRELFGVRKDGSQFPVEVGLNPISSREGLMVLSSIVDMTEKIAVEAQVRQAQKMEAVGQLTGGIAHDFNNILTVITGTIEILAEAVADKPEVAPIAKLIEEAADRGAALTQRLLAFARRQPLQPRKVDVNELILDTAKLLRPTLGEQIEIQSTLEDDLWPSLVDPHQLSTSVLNLALNARDAMPDGGKLIFETRNVQLDESYARANSDVEPGRYVMVAVTDTGTGIPAAIRDRVFEPFFTTKGVGKGTGLGLSMVYGFVKQSGGHIKIYSEEGHGTAIKLYLPRARELDAAADVVPASPIEGGHETVLVVEDDPPVRALVTTQLESLGYTALAASNGAEALRMIEQGVAFDLLFTDVIMPGGMNGRQLAEEAMRRRPSLKVLFTSGYTEDAIVHHGRLDPGVLLLAKPYRKSDLAHMIRAAITR
jgi:PAS domain S-box-containing protein